MAEVLVVVAGTASFAQLLGQIIQTSEAVHHIYTAVKDAPAKIRRIKDKLSLLRRGLEEIQQYLQSFEDNVVLPIDLREAIAESIRRINGDIQEVQNAFQTHGSAVRMSLRERLKWALGDQRKVDKLLSRLDFSEDTLDRMIQLVNLRTSLLTCLAMKQSMDAMQTLQSALNSIQPDKNKDDQEVLIKIDSIIERQSVSSLSNINRKQAIIKADSWLRFLGFYGSIHLISSAQRSTRARVMIGFKPPTWMCNASIDLAAEFATLSSQEFGLRLLPGEIKIQARISPTSPFMLACLHGDVKLIEQHLKEKTGSVRDRTTCTGTTPLLAAIKGKHIKAVRCLLENAADPDIGDDDQVLPVFAALGLYPRHNKHFLQLPPNWSSWLATFKLLVEHGASVHEEVYDRTLSTLNLRYAGPGIDIGYIEPKTVDFFRILHSQCYFDFDRTSQGIWCASLAAIRSTTDSVEALQFLARVGADLTRISERGATTLHWAAEMACDVQTLEYLCSTPAIEHLDRQDLYGWTPLHYAVASGRFGYREVAFGKIQYLLQKGADLCIRAREHPIFYVDSLDSEEFTALELSRALKTRFHTQFEEDTARILRGTPSQDSEDIFFETLEEQVA